MAFHKIGHIPIEGNLALKQKRAFSFTVLDDGQRRMRDRLIERGLSMPQIDVIEAHTSQQYQDGQGVCESPIERMMLAALVTADWRSDAETLPHVCKQQDACRPDAELVIVPQFLFLRTRMDFAVSVRRGSEDHRMWCVECDGEAFHQDAIAHRKRDDFLNSWGIQVLHLSGSEIHKDCHSALSRLVHQINSWRLAGNERAALV